MKILVVHLGMFGDALLFSPVFDQAVKQWGTPVDLLCSSSSSAVFEHRPGIKKLISFPILDYEKKSGWSRWCHKRDLVRRIRQGRYDAIYDFTASKFSAVLGVRAGIPNRYGINRKNRQKYYTVTARDPGKTTHILQGFIQIATDWGMTVDFSAPDWPVSPLVGEQVQAWWLHHSFDGIRLAVHAGSNSPYKNWPVERFAKLLRRLTTDYNLQAYLIGGPSERKINMSVATAVGPRVIDLTPELKTFHHTAEFLRSMDLSLGCDSGPGHLAAAVGLPVITIFSHYSSTYGHPLADRGRIIEKELPCRPCANPRFCINGHRLECLDHSVATVYHEAVDMVEQLGFSKNRRLSKDNYHII